MKVFCTVGSKLPFDRLIQAVADREKVAQDLDVFYQIGQGGSCKPKECAEQVLSVGAYAEKMAWADLVVSHAGMGTILTALTNAKPILVMPRKSTAGEVLNDHQLYTAARLRDVGLVHVAEDERCLAKHLAKLSNLGTLRSLGTLASDQLIERVRSEIVRFS